MSAERSATPVLCDVGDGVATLTLNRPAVHNVIDAATIAGLEAALERVEGDPEVRAVVLTGAGEATFCAGGDLGYFARLDAPAGVREMAERMGAVLDRLESGERPVIGAMNGSAYGGGCEILLACHLRLAAETAVLQFRQARLGMVTGWGGAERLFSLVGRSRGLRLLLTGEAVDADAALRLGLVDEICPPASVLAAATALARRMAARPAAAIRGFLELAHAPVSARARRRETELFTELWQAPDFQAALRRFSERAG